jgi:hypothetical protein
MDFLPISRRWSELGNTQPAAYFGKKHPSVDCTSSATACVKVPSSSMRVPHAVRIENTTHVRPPSEPCRGSCGTRGSARHVSLWSDGLRRAASCALGRN